jgi:hypothetical protein
MKKLLTLACLISLVTGVAFAKEAPKKASASSGESRIGLGFNTQLSNFGVSSLSLRYWGSDNLGFEGLFGFSFGDNTRFLDLGGKILALFKKEQNMDLYGFGLLGIENYKIGDTSDTNLTIGGGVGVEFFLPGLPNLGFGTELGLFYNNGTKVFGTVANWIPQVGMRYYF